jgi:hypothetical protein
MARPLRTFPPAGGVFGAMAPILATGAQNAQNAHCALAYGTCLLRTKRTQSLKTVRFVRSRVRATGKPYVRLPYRYLLCD